MTTLPQLRQTYHSNARYSVTQEEVNASHNFLDNANLASLTPFLAKNQSPTLPFLGSGLRSSQRA